MILGSRELGGQTCHEAGRQLLKELWEAHVGGEMPQIAIADRGKPYFVDSSWHFSISHTKKHVFCVIHEKNLGIDAEEMDREINLRLADKILSPVEKAQFEASEDKRLALLKFWVLKEADAKRTGDGLRGYPNHTDFSLDTAGIREMDNCLVAILTD